MLEIAQEFKKEANYIKERTDMLRRLRRLIIDNQEALAQLLAAEQGKPIAEARGEVRMSASYVMWFAEEARRIYGETIPSPWAERRIMVTKEPVGVVGAITPWNFPSSMLARKIAPAIAAGCTVVCKPAEATPYSGIAWGIMCEKAGIPPGVVNILTGDPITIGEELTSNPNVHKITFTGSTRVGKILMAQSVPTVKKISMEMGGNAPFIVFDDADIDRAVEGAMASKFRNSGQTCVCTNKGGKVVTGGKRHELGHGFFEPTVISDATQDMMFSQDEIFGPVAPVYKFETEEEVVAMANDTDFGLACYFYTQDLGRTFRVMEGLEYGLVGVNEGVITAVEAPFGGFKQSGVGKEGGNPYVLKTDG